MGSRQPMSDETMVLFESKDTHIGNVVSETDNSADKGKAETAKFANSEDCTIMDKHPQEK
ncbi:hypothetical protein T06_14723 [Trichinella sp. T6]|nr:hypothetical protein T06_14723 [Trichinella sp. T6]